MAYVQCAGANTARHDGGVVFGGRGWGGGTRCWRHPNERVVAAVMAQLHLQVHLLKSSPGLAWPGLGAWTIVSGSGRAAQWARAGGGAAHERASEAAAAGEGGGSSQHGGMVLERAATPSAASMQVLAPAASGRARGERCGTEAAAAAAARAHCNMVEWCLSVLAHPVQHQCRCWHQQRCGTEAAAAAGLIAIWLNGACAIHWLCQRAGTTSE